jgi:hypothetical protein
MAMLMYNIWYPWSDQVEEIEDFEMLYRYCIVSHKKIVELLLLSQEGQHKFCHPKYTAQPYPCRSTTTPRS